MNEVYLKRIRDVSWSLSFLIYEQREKLQQDTIYMMLLGLSHEMYNLGELPNKEPEWKPKGT